MEVRITTIRVAGEISGSPVIQSGERTAIDVLFTSFEKRDDVTVGIIIRDRFGQDIFGTNTFHYGISFPFEKDGRYRCRFLMAMNIAPGKYSISAALHTEDVHCYECFNWKDRAADFEVVGQKGSYFIGLVRLEPEVSVTADGDGMSQNG